jgi:hypothetical protein
MTPYGFVLVFKVSQERAASIIRVHLRIQQTLDHPPPQIKIYLN